MVPGVELIEVKGGVKDALFWFGFPGYLGFLFLWGGLLKIFGEI